MESLFRYVSPPGQCGYLPHETWSLEYELVGQMTAREYQERMLAGWRRFGHYLFRPRCPNCTKCWPIRVDVAHFRPDRSQRRNARRNADRIQIRIGEPSVTREKLRLYDRFHAHQTDLKGWPEHPAKDAENYFESYVRHPFATQEWCYYLEGVLVGVGYVDDLPDGLSAIYFVHEPNLRQFGLGVFNVVSLIRVSAKQGFPYLYLGYYVPGSASMEYKAGFVPNEVLRPGADWQAFRS